MKITAFTGVCDNSDCPSKRVVENEELGAAFTEPAELVLVNDKGQCVWCDNQIIPKEQLTA